MEFPFGHHHHHNRRDEEDDNRNPPPPHFSPAINDSESFYPALSAHHVSHQPASEYAPPPALFEPSRSEYAPPPPPAFFEAEGPPRPSHYAGDPYGREEDGGFSKRQQTVRVFTKAEEGFSLAIRDGKVVLAREDPGDEYQHWIKDMRYSTTVKDEESFPAFALVNRATGEAIKHSFGATHPVQLVPYNPNSFDESILWTESRDLGDGFRCIRMVNNISLNFDAFNGDEQHGGVHDGTIIVLWEWLKGKNQRWKIVPY